MTASGAQTRSATSRGITGFGAYLPRLRLPRDAVVAAHRWMAPKGRASGSKAFCSWDEDAVTMAVEAARAVLPGCGHGIDSIAVASTTMPNADLQHSAIIATVLDLPGNIRTADTGFSRRSATSALLAGLEGSGEGTLVIASENLLAKPASPQELQYGAGAAAFTLGTTNVLARVLAAESVTSPLVDHFRQRQSDYDYYWEERWVRDEIFGKLVMTTVSRVLDAAGQGIDEIQYLVCPSPAPGPVSLLAKKLGFNGVVVDALREDCGFTGAADPLLGLIAALEQSRPGDRVLLLGLGQGCDALVLEVTPAVEGYTSGKGLSAALGEGVVTDSYLRMLSFAGLYEPDWGMRGEKEVRTALTDLYRSVDQIWKFEAGKCSQCGVLQFPQLAYCVGCKAPAAEFERVSLADKTGRILTFTADWLTYHPSPPLYAGFIQFGDEARLLMEIVDVGPNGIAEETPVKMVFRVKDRDKLRGWTRYFWKATVDNQQAEVR